MNTLKRIWGFLHAPERFFIGTSLVFGSAFLLLFPPFQTPDEIAHFFRAYQVSEFQIAPVAHGNVIGADLPKSLTETVKVVDPKPFLRFNSNFKYDLHKVAAALHINLNQQDKVFTPNLAGYSPVGYLPQATAIFIGRVFNVHPVVLIYLARLASLVTWIGLMFISIRLIPYRKWTLAALGLLPMIIAQAVSPGIDVISIGLSIVLISFVLNLRGRKAINTRSLIILLVLGSLIALTKQTSILALGFLLLLKPEQFGGSLKRYWLTLSALVGVPLLVYAAWNAFTSRLGLNVASSVAGQDAHAQISLLLHNPFRFVDVLFNTFFTTWGDDVIRSFIGNFGWTDTPLPGGIVAIGFVFLAFVLAVNYESLAGKKLTRIQALIISLIAVMYAVGTCMALYIYYSPVDFSIVYGLQGRYFLLIAFIVVPLFMNMKLKVKQMQYSRIVMAGSLFLLVASTLTIYLRYYVSLF